MLLIKMMMMRGFLFYLCRMYITFGVLKEYMYE